MTPLASTFVGSAVWLLGLCVGSFLNVVIYRLPRGLSPAEPARSFCPNCRHPIAAYDNIPVLSWLLLRGRCRHCRAAISVQYPLVEAATGLAFALTYYLLFVLHARAGLTAPGLPHDAALLLTWLVLVAAMIACAATDLHSYMIDTRVTNVVVGAGLLLHALWPRAEFVAPAAQGPWGAAALAAGLVCLLMLWRTVWCKPPQDDDLPTTTDAPPPPTGAAVGVVATLIMVALAAWVLATPLMWQSARHIILLLPAPFVLAALFALTVIVGGQPRAADAEIEAVVEDEGPAARRAVLGELAWLAPSALAGLAAGLAVMLLPPAAAVWTAAMHWSPGGGFVPLAGVTFATHGAVIGALAGWLLRIVFTFAFGREAFGIGDIYILAAAGAALGWDMALLGLLFSVGLALAGWLLGLLLKRVGMIPFGPWLALGFVVALWLNDAAVDVLDHYADNLRFAWEQRPDMLAVGGGVMLVGCAAAIVLARLARRLVEPPSS